MTSWTHRQTQLPDAPEDDRTVYRGGRPVGRIHLTGLRNTEWSWSTWTYPASHGRVVSMEEAQRAVRRAAGRLPVLNKDAGVTRGIRADWRDDFQTSGRPADL